MVISKLINAARCITGADPGIAVRGGHPVLPLPFLSLPFPSIPSPPLEVGPLKSS